MQSVQVCSLGGMCWVRKWLEEWKVIGAKGPFDEAATIPQVLRHMFVDDFKELLTAEHFYNCPHSNHEALRHEFYEHMAQKILQQKWPFCLMHMF